MPRISAFTSEGHQPIPVRIAPDGKSEYLAAVSLLSTSLRLPSYWDAIIITTVTEGARAVVYRDGDGKRRTSEDFYVLVLRFDPDFYTSVGRRKPAAAADRRDWAGPPIYWTTKQA